MKKNLLSFLINSFKMLPLPLDFYFFYNDRLKIFVFISLHGGDIKKIGDDVKNLLDKYYIYLEVNHKKQKTQDQYKRSARYFIDFIGKEPEEIIEDDVQEYGAYLNKKYKQNTVTSYILGLDLYLTFIGKEHLRIPIPKWEMISRDTITKQEIQKIREHVMNKPEENLVILFITDLDARVGEICDAKWRYIRGNRYYFKEGKTGDTYGFITQELQNALLKYEEVRPTPKKGHEEYILLNKRKCYKGKRLSPTGFSIRRIVTDITIDCIGRRLTPYDLRASVITEELNNYVNPKIVQRKARHRSFKTTMRYNHVDDKIAEEYADSGTIFDINNSISKQSNKNSSDRFYKGRYI